MSSLTRINLSPDNATLQRCLEAAAGVALPHWSNVAPHIKTMHFQAGDTVFDQGVVHPYVYVVQGGLVRLTYFNDNGEEWIKSFIQEGMFFASISALQGPHETSFAAVCQEEVQVQRAPFEIVDRLATENLAWCMAIHRITMAVAARKEQRERELLTLTAEQRYRLFHEAQPALEQRLPQHALARYLGVTPVGLNRIIARVRSSDTESR